MGKLPEVVNVSPFLYYLASLESIHVLSGRHAIRLNRFGLKTDSLLGSTKVAVARSKRAYGYVKHNQNLRKPRINSNLQ